MSDVSQICTFISYEPLPIILGLWGEYLTVFTGYLWPDNIFIGICNFLISHNFIVLSVLHVAIYSSYLLKSQPSISAL